MKHKLLLLFVLLGQFLVAAPKDKVVTGPSIALIMQPGHYMSPDLIQFTFQIKNNGDEPLTNIYVTNLADPNSSGINISTNNPSITAIATLAPGEEDFYTFMGNKFSPCVDFSQTMVHATTLANVEITDLSSDFSYYDDYQTFTMFNPMMQFVQHGTYQDSNSNSIVDVGDIVHFDYYLNFSETFGLNFTYHDNNAIVDNPNGDTNTNWTSTGTHYITQADIDLGYIYNSPSIELIPNCGNPDFNINIVDSMPCNNCPSPTYCNYNCIVTRITPLLPNLVTGSVKFNVANDNCATGIPYPNRAVTTGNSTTTYTSFTDTNGNYSIYIPNSGNFSTSASVNLGSNLSSNPLTVSQVSAGENMNYATNFCISSTTSVNDLDVVLYPVDHARPGFNSYYLLYFTNNGSTNLNGTIQLTFDNGKLSFVNANPAVQTSTASTLTWNYTNLLPFQQRIIAITFNAFVPPTVNQGDVLTFTSVGNPIAGDTNPSNNTAVLNQTVVSSFDPNDKTVLEGALITQAQASKPLHYITRFQNTGTFAANTVVIKETLDANLDWTTFEPIGASHNYTVQIKNGNELTCTFATINLPYAAANEAASHGWFAYKIKPKSTFAIGDVASSSSAIYFDYNPPILTNTVTTQIAALATAGFGKNNFQIYPNPAKNYFSIETNVTETSTYEVVDINGKTLLTGTVTNKKRIDTSALRSGFYLVTIKSKKATQTYKLIKE